jgi:hypothetical protein
VIEVADEVDFPNFTTIAERQQFRPLYAVFDAVIANTYRSSHPDYDNIANALSVTETRYGEERTPGMQPTAATQRCDKIFAAHGRPTAWAGTGITSTYCADLWLFKAAVDHAPVLRRNAVAAGLQASKSVDLPYPAGPNDFTAPGTTYGGEDWRVAQFLTSCSCWRVVDATFHPSFP